MSFESQMISTNFRTTNGHFAAIVLDSRAVIRGINARPIILRRANGVLKLDLLCPSITSHGILPSTD